MWFAFRCDGAHGFSQVIRVEPRAVQELDLVQRIHHCQHRPQTAAAGKAKLGRSCAAAVQHRESESGARVKRQREWLPRQVQGQGWRTGMVASVEQGLFNATDSQRTLDRDELGRCLRRKAEVSARILPEAHPCAADVDRLCDHCSLEASVSPMPSKCEPHTRCELASAQMWRAPRTATAAARRSCVSYLSTESAHRMMALLPRYALRRATMSTGIKSADR